MWIKNATSELPFSEVKQWYSVKEGFPELDIEDLRPSFGESIESSINPPEPSGRFPCTEARYNLEIDLSLNNFGRKLRPSGLIPPKIYPLVPTSSRCAGEYVE